MMKPLQVQKVLTID